MREVNKKWWEYMSDGMKMIRSAPHDGSYIQENYACAVGTIEIGMIGFNPKNSDRRVPEGFDAWALMDQIKVQLPVQRYDEQPIVKLGDAINYLFEDARWPRYRIRDWMKKLDV